MCQVKICCMDTTLELIKWGDFSMLSCLQISALNWLRITRRLPVNKHFIPLTEAQYEWKWRKERHTRHCSQTQIWSLMEYHFLGTAVCYEDMWYHIRYRLWTLFIEKLNVPFLECIIEIKCDTSYIYTFTGQASNYW